MYVSSFNTYVSADSLSKTRPNKSESNKDTPAAFETELLSKTVKNLDTSSKFPINYISNYKALNNQQKLQENPQSSEKTKFIKLEAEVEAKTAYSDNSQIFSLILAHRATLDQTPKINKKLPEDIQNIKEENLRQTMLNTYIANENYYKITA